MVFNWGSSGVPASGQMQQQQQRRQQQAGAAGSVDAIGAQSLPGPGLASMTEAVESDVSWAPLPSAAGSDAGRKPKQPPPFGVKKHDVKARLQDRSTAVVDLVSVVDAPGDVMFDLLADPHQHENIFDAIESAKAELVSEEGAVRKWRLDYRTRWSFWKVGGVCDSRLWMTTDREAGTVSFALREPGFLRKYEGSWTITGPDGRGPGAATATGRQPPATAAAAAATSGTAVSTSCTDEAPAGSAPTTPATTDASPRDRYRLGAGSAAPPSSLAPRSATPGHSTASDADTGPCSHALSMSMPSHSSSSSFTSCSSFRSSSSGSLDRSSVGSLSGGESPAARSTLGIGRGGGGGGGGVAAGLLAAINNPFFAAPALPRLNLFRTQERDAAAAAAAAGAAASAITAAAAASDPAVASSAQPAPAPAARRYPTTIQVRKAISPKISPPYPINQVLKGHASGQVSDMLEGLLAATARKVALEEEAGQGQGQGQARGSVQ